MFLRLLIVPLIFFATLITLGVFIIRGFHRIHHSKARPFDYSVIIIGAFLILLTAYGHFIGIHTINVNRTEYQTANLPQGFDNYKILLFSDAHLSSFNHKKDLLCQAIDYINNEKPDLICFCGDIQTRTPEEITPFIQNLKQLTATDGIVSILGNHDYSLYNKGITDKERKLLTQKTINLQKKIGWNVLLNEHITIHRGNDSIVIAGEENGGSGPFPDYSDPDKTLKGVNKNTFTIMLQHDPTAWRKHILSKTNAQLTLSGHTHGGQISIFGLSPASLVYNEYRGWYNQGDKALFVTTGLGSVVPFRYGLQPEVVSITLKKA